MDLISVYDADGVHFRMVDEEQALTLLEHQAAFINTKRRRIKLRLTVDHSTARVLLAPRYPLGSTQTIYTEYVGEQRHPLYQHSRKCEGFGVVG